jgi:LytS/YehU family sensor histidine kinase
VLTLSVADNGRGLTAASGSGVGLANIRARLAALYGKRAALALEANTPRGVVAIIRLPLT